MRTCAGGVLVRGGELLLARRADDRPFYPGAWDVIGGHCEPGEAPVDALVREVEEEIGVVPRAFREVAVLGEPQPERHGPAEYHIFAVTRWTGGEPRRLGAEHSDLRWVPLERALELPLAHPEYPRVLRMALIPTVDGAPLAATDAVDSRVDPRLAPHPEIRALLDELLTRARAVLGARLVGLYVGGSLAIGDFQRDRSDVDFVAVTDGEIGEDDVRALAALQARLAAGSRWGNELEGSYVSRDALGAPGLRQIRHPYIDRGTRTLAVIDVEGGYWEIQRWLLREHGIAVSGPPLRDVIDAVGPERLRAAVANTLREWWRPMLAEPTRLAAAPGYRCYAVLTMCRMLYTLRHGAIATKPVAARWAVATLAPRWTPLIERALGWPPDAAPDLGDVLALIRHTGEAGDRWRRAAAVLEGAE